MEPRARIEHEYRVRFDEADADGRLRPSGLLRYAQDMAWRHSTEAGFDRAWYAERDMSWLVRNVTVSLVEPITYGDVLSISTQITGWRSIWARRHTEVRRVGSDGGHAGDVVMAEVDTDWVMLTLQGRPAKVPAEMARYFSTDQEFARERVRLPEPTDEVTTLSTRVRPLDVDPLRHMNNAAYLDMVDDGLARMPSRQRLESPDLYRVGYVLPALPDTSIDISCWAAGERQIACRISAGEGNELTKALVSRSDGSR